MVLGYVEQHIIVMGDMNCKIGDLIDGNKEKISKGGNMMIKMDKRSRRERSIIIIGEEDENGVESL